MSQDLTNALSSLTDELTRHRRTYDGAIYDGDGDVSDDSSDAPMEKQHDTDLALPAQ